MKSRVIKGVLAGLAATVVVSILDLAGNWIQSAMSVQEPWFHSFASLLAAVGNQVLGLPNAMWVGWTLHFLAGALVLGAAFGVLCPRLPTDTPETKGIVFAVGAWLAMMLLVMPLHPQLGVFAAGAGFGTVAWMLVTHVVFGIVLGGVYAWQVDREKRAARAAPTGTAPA